MYEIECADILCIQAGQQVPASISNFHQHDERPHSRVNGSVSKSFQATAHSESNQPNRRLRRVWSLGGDGQSWFSAERGEFVYCFPSKHFHNMS